MRGSDVRSIYHRAIYWEWLGSKIGLHTFRPDSNALEAVCVRDYNAFSVHEGWGLELELGGSNLGIEGLVFRV